MWLSPFPAVWKARTTREMGELNPLPFVVTVLNCVGWTMYSCLTKDVFIFLGNISGLILGLFYTITSMTVIAKKSEGDSFSEQYTLVEGLLLFAFLFWGLMAFFCVTIFNDFPDPIKEATAMVGLVSCAFSIAYYAAPLSTMYTVISKQDSSSLYLPMIVVNLINALLWFSYGAFGTQDINIWLPNLLGIILAGCQSSLVFMFKKGTFWEALIGSTKPATTPSIKGNLDSNRSTSAIKMPYIKKENEYDFEEANSEDDNNLLG